MIRASWFGATRSFFAFAVVFSMLVGIAGSTPSVRANPPPESTPVPAQTVTKNGPVEATSVGQPAPTAESGTAVADQTVGSSTVTAPNPKNSPDTGNMELTATHGSASVSPSVLSSNQPLTCGDSGNLTFDTVSANFQVVRRCTFDFPTAGSVLIAADSTLVRLNGDYEARFEIGVDSTAGDENIDRWVDVFSDSAAAFPAASMILSVTKPVTAGTHTFYLLVKRSGGTGTVRLYDPTLSVTFVPSVGSDLLTCGASGNLHFQTASNSFVAVRQCTLTVPTTGRVFISADSSLDYVDGKYEAWFRLGIDDLVGINTTDRWVDVLNDSSYGIDTNAGLSVVRPVFAGQHTFYLLVSRYSGTGTVHLYDPTLSVIYVPTLSPSLKGCVAAPGATFDFTSDNLVEVLQCTITAPSDGRVFISADTSLAYADAAYEARFEIGTDNLLGNSEYQRRARIYHGSASDGLDRNLRLSVVQPVTAGQHTYYFLVTRALGTTGTVRLIDPTLTVMFVKPGTLHSYLPLVVR